MKKAQFTKSLHVLISPEDMEVLKRVAKRRHISVAELIRQLIETL